MTVTPALLRLRYPAFAQVPDDTITYWLADAGRIVTDWGADTAPATMALAAHNMVLTPGVITDAGDPREVAIAKLQAAGITTFRSASFSASFSEAMLATRSSGEYKATPYGLEFAVMLRRNAGGPMLVGWVPCDDEWVL